DWYDHIQEKIAQIAAENCRSISGIIDNHKPLSHRIDLFDDYLHPSEQGASIIANNVARYIMPIAQELSVNETIGSHMVLQRDRPNVISGTATPGKTVVLKIDGAATTTLTDQLGNWVSELAPKAAGGPYQMIVSTDKDSIIFKDILF